MSNGQRVRAWLGVALLTSAGVPALGGFATSRAVFRANGDGTGIEQVIPSNVAQGRGSLSADSQHLYWLGGFFGDQDSNWIRRSGLDGSNVQDIFGSDFFTDVKVDSQKAKLYFTTVADCNPGCGSISRIDLDGSSYEMLFSADAPGTIAVYPPDDLVCWSEVFVDEILCGTVGDDAGQVVVLDSAAGMAIDPLQHKLYCKPSVKLVPKRGLEPPPGCPD